MNRNTEITIRRATPDDAETIAEIGRFAVELSHRESCSKEDMNEFLSAHYNLNALRDELTNAENQYHVIFHGDQCAGFSKIIFNKQHPNIPERNVTKLDRIYLAEAFFDMQLGYKLLQFNLELARQQNQSGLWLFTWTGNARAVNFYKRAGFKIIGSHKFRVTDTHYNPNHHMLLTF